MKKHIKQEPMFRFLLILTICGAVGLQGWRTLINNFSVEIVNLEGHHIGIIQAVREIPGFLSLMVVFLLFFMKEHRLSAYSIACLGLGVALTGLLPTFPGVITTTLIMSFGFHYYETTNQSLTLQYFDKKISPWVFGKLKSIAAISNIFVGMFIFLVKPVLSYSQIYLIIGILIILVALYSSFQNPVKEDIIPQKKKMVFKKKYWLYYFLNFMAGARRQIFVAFAIFLMVKKFHFSVQEVTILFIINNIVNYYLAPLIGRGIIRFGERKILSLEYFSLIFIFLAYTVVQGKILVGLLYVLDHVFFNFSIAIRTYFQKTGDPRDIAPSMAMGFTINHIAAVILPAVGGFLWLIDYRIPFLLGSFFSLISLLMVQKIKIRTGSDTN